MAYDLNGIMKKKPFPEETYPYDRKMLSQIIQRHHTIEFCM